MRSAKRPGPFRYVDRYVLALFGNVKIVVGGAAFAAIGWLLTGQPWFPKYFWQFTAVLILFLVVVSGFLAWRREHEKLLAEEARNGLPRFKGFIKGVNLRATPHADRDKIDTDIQVAAYVYNESPTPAGIKGFVMTVATRDGVVYTERNPREELVMFPDPFQCFEQNAGREFGLSMSIEGLSPAEINCDSVRIRVQDALMDEHVIDEHRYSYTSGELALRIQNAR